MKRSFLILTSFILYVACFGQHTIAVKAQVIHYQQGPMKKIRVIVNNQFPAITDEAGIFTVTLPGKTTSIKINLTQGDYQILYPLGGYIAIPRNLDDMPQVIIGSARQNIYLQQYIMLYEERKKITPSSAMALRQANRKMDSLRNLLRLYRYTESDLKKEESRQDGKDAFYPEISTAVTDYLKKTYSLITAFRLLSPVAMDHPALMQHLIDAGNSYNESYSQIDRQQLNYQRKLSAFWQNDSLTAAYNELVSFSQKKMHPEKIFPLQAVILQMKQYSTGRKKRMREKLVIQQQAATVMKDLETAYNQLEKRTYAVLGYLRE